MITFHHLFFFKKKKNDIKAQVHKKIFIVIQVVFKLQYLEATIIFINFANNP